MKTKKIVIIGAGSGGVAGASQLVKYFSPSDIAIVDKLKDHCYQPMLTLVGGGCVPREDTIKPMSSVIPKGIEWLQNYVESVDPENNTIKLDDGEMIKYEYLLVAPGFQLDWHKIKGLEGNIGKNGICSNYSYDTVNTTRDAINNFKGGTAVFTFPTNPIKCPGAPQKIMWLAEESFRNMGIREKTKVVFLSAGGSFFGIERYCIELDKLAKERNIEAMFMHNLSEVDAENKKLKAINLKTNEEVEMDFDMLHISPPMSSPDFLKKSSISTCHNVPKEELDAEWKKLTPSASSLGFVDVDKFTTQHNRFKNIFSIGDASSMPCSKTGAAIRKQAPVMALNLHAFSEGKDLKEKYDGYASCPLVVDRGHVILAEFGYDGKIMESFPFNQAKPSRLMWILKRYMLAPLYWYMMLRGKS